ncbi:hypothetical protein BC829DRAFT_416332 [Chytridium lagenaria]|nr:hypothetical protein BC829DRAFT_416332 [Chytridium lagenaria]
MDSNVSSTSGSLDDLAVHDLLNDIDLHIASAGPRGQSIEMAPRSKMSRFSAELDAAFTAPSNPNSLIQDNSSSAEPNNRYPPHRRSADGLSTQTIPDQPYDEDALLLENPSSDSIANPHEWASRRKSNPPSKITTIPAISSFTPKSPSGYDPISPVFDILSTGGIERAKPWTLEDVGSMPESQFLATHHEVGGETRGRREGWWDGKDQGIDEPDHLDEMPYWQLAIARIPALAVTMLLELGVGAVVASYDDILKEHIIMAAFMPVLSAVSGCIGLQASAATLRGLATGHASHTSFKEIARVLLKEAFAAAVVGLIAGLALFFVSGVWGKSFGLAAVTGGSIWLSSVLSSMFGSLGPVFWKTVGVDPAVAAGPFETAIQDLIGLTM